MVDLKCVVTENVEKSKNDGKCGLWFDNLINSMVFREEYLET